MKRNLMIKLAYDGSCYSGWQDNRSLPSIEGVLREAIEKILREKIVLQAASRTDAGVHAEGQVVNFFTEKTLFPISKLKRGINALLPDDIAVRALEEASFDFHPTIDCKKKEYRYYICMGESQLPQQRLYSWHCPYNLDLIAMREAAHHFLGRHDFQAFTNCRSTDQYESNIRTIERLELEELPGNRLSIQIEGGYFLYKMVRIMVGSLVYVGRGKLSAEDLPQVLVSRDRKKAAVTAPAHGLHLHRIDYCSSKKATPNHEYEKK